MFSVADPADPSPSDRTRRRLLCAGSSPRVFDGAAVTLEQYPVADKDGVLVAHTPLSFRAAGVVALAASPKAV